jgi:transmembrane sensor
MQNRHKQGFMDIYIDRIVELVIKHLKGDLNESERVELQLWMEESGENRSAVEEFMTGDSLRIGLSDLYAVKERIWQRLDGQIQENEHHNVVRFPRRSWRKYGAAAAIVLLVGGSALLLFDRYRDSCRMPVKSASRPFVKHDVTPGGNKAVLILAGGSAITLDSAKSGNLARLGNTNVVKVDNGELAYHPSEHEGQGPEGYNELRTPRGGQYRLILPDGTRVWLNAASSIQFPTAFREAVRKVTVTGEAYFEVARDVVHPFIVNVDNRMQVDVLGTRFNVNAYSDETSLNTTLLQGSVRVVNGNQITPLTPDQQFRIYNNGRSEVMDGADIEAIVAWKNGQFQFESDNITAVMRQIARWYDVDVLYAGKIPEGTFSGEVSRNTNLSNVLKIFELSGLHFKIENNKVTVLP